MTVRVQVEHTEGKKRMIFRAYASKNPGVWGGPQGALMAQTRNNKNRKFTIFAIQLLPRIKTGSDPGAAAPGLRGGRVTVLVPDSSCLLRAATAME